MSKITTHILDMAKGGPAEGVGVILYRQGDGPAGSADVMEIVRGRTNKDGRIVDWGSPGGGADSGFGSGEVAGVGAIWGLGIYKIRFATKDYFDRQSVTTFYPFVEIHFEITSDGHYHIPLLISPFGYTTYRGS
jgi:5-hydroxyisourate hydrolase